MCVRACVLQCVRAPVRVLKHLFKSISIGGRFKHLNCKWQRNAYINEYMQSQQHCMHYVLSLHAWFSTLQRDFQCLLFIASPFLTDDKKCITWLIVSFKADSKYMSEYTHAVFRAKDVTCEHEAYMLYTRSSSELLPLPFCAPVFHNWSKHRDHRLRKSPWIIAWETQAFCHT